VVLVWRKGIKNKLNKKYWFKNYLKKFNLWIRPCDETFAGPYADSEPETLAVENALKNKTGNWDAYISIHR
jgi:hypothetical protein